MLKEMESQAEETKVGMNCAEAIQRSQEEFVAFSRYSWKHIGQFVYFVSATERTAINEVERLFIGEKVKRRAYFALKTKDGDIVPWTPSSGDLVAQDYFIIRSLKDY